jgi:exodeoxyribonuclease V alpha subunit
MAVFLYIIPMNPAIPSAPDSFSPLDLHFARLMEKFSGSRPNPSLLLAAALASNAVQDGHICVDLSDYAGTAMLFSNPPAPAGQWPDLRSWNDALAATPVVGVPGEYRPLVLSGTRLYLYRYWDYERRLVAVLLKRSKTDMTPCDTKAAAECLRSLFPERQEEINWQKTAAAVALFKKLTVISGGPGTGKTTTVIRIAAILATLSKEKNIRFLLAAPTGKAAARLEESIAAQLPALGLPPDIAALMPRTASTIHSLLGTIPDSPYFRHDANNPLSCDAVIVDEASMVDCALMTKLLDAVPPTARVILIGDKDQLASVEPGAVLGDLCGSGSEQGYSPALCAAIQSVMPEFTIAGRSGPPIADSIVTLRKNYRFGTDSGIGRVSRAVNQGNADETAALLKNTAISDCVWWIPSSYDALLERLQKVVLDVMGDLRRSSDPLTALDLFARFRILCAVRNGPLGVTAMNSRVEAMLAAAGLINAKTLHYRGRPIMITRNDYGVDLYNGDIGVIMPDHDDNNTLKAFFAHDRSLVRSVSLHQLPPHETAYSLTVHKAQGSEFKHTVLILPSLPSPVVTRELLYTGITRSRDRCELWCTEEVLRSAVASRIKRTSGIREALWGKHDGESGYSGLIS